jgi:hypothetical protein
MSRQPVQATRETNPCGVRPDISVGHFTNIPLGSNILRVPDGLSEYLTHSRVGVARVFDYSTQWSESWRP